LDQANLERKGFSLGILDFEEEGIIDFWFEQVKTAVGKGKKVSSLMFR
jgi:hypothetical protein